MADQEKINAGKCDKLAVDGQFKLQYYSSSLQDDAKNSPAACIAKAFGV